MIKVETYSGYAEYDKAEIQDMLDRLDMYIEADNIPGWIDRALCHTMKNAWARRKVITGILNAMLNGDIQKLDFIRDEDGHLIGLKTKVSVYLKGESQLLDQCLAQKCPKCGAGMPKKPKWNTTHGCTEVYYCECGQRFTHREIVVWIPEDKEDA